MYVYIIRERIYFYIERKRLFISKKEITSLFALPVIKRNVYEGKFIESKTTV